MKKLILIITISALLLANILFAADAQLQAPDGLHAAPGVNAATLSWQPVSGADGYRIYWQKGADVTSSSTCLATVATETSSYEATHLSPGESYNFRISAYRGGEESQLSHQAGVIPSNGEAPRLQDGVR